MSVALPLIDPDARCGSYTRISKARGTGPETTAGVRRQAEENQVHAEGLEWIVDEVYVDNDISASGKKRRPEFERLLADLEAGRFRKLVVWHPDRLLRVRGDLDRLIDVCVRRKVRISTVKAGSMDYQTATGRLMNGLLTLVSTFELEHLVERIEAKHDQLAREGKPNGGSRPFGFERDRKTHRAPAILCRISDRTEVMVDEPAVIRDLAKRVLAGESMHALARELNDRGIPTVSGTRWQPNTIRQLLRAARISGRREVFTFDGQRRTRGEVSAKAVWQPIISVEESDALRALIGNADRFTKYARAEGKSSSSRALLSGLLLCQLCGSRMYSAGGEGSKHTMKCHGCGGVRVRTDFVTGPIAEAVIERVNQGDLDAALREETDTEAAGELVVVEQNLTRLATAFGAGGLSYDEWEAARTPLVARQKALKERVERSRQHVALTGLPHPLRGSWGGLSVAQQRSILAFFIARIEVLPAKGNGRGFQDRVRAEWKR